MNRRPKARTVSGAGRGAARSGAATRPARVARPKKTAEELDQEMTDYFDAK